MFRKKRAVKFRYTITFVSASGLNDGSFVHVAWKRGSKSANHGETSQQEVSGGSVDWNETVTVLCTLFSSGGTASGYEEKDLVLTLTEFNVDKKKDVVLGKLVVDLSEFALAGSEAETKYHNVKPAKKGGASAGGPFVLVMSYMAEVLSEGDADAASETDVGGDAEASVADDFDADDANAVEDPFAPSAVAAAAASASPKPPSPGHGGKKKGAHKNKRAASATSLGASPSPKIVVTAPPGSGNDDAAAASAGSSSGVNSALNSTGGSVAASVATVTVPAGEERLADVVRERDELRQTVEQLRRKAARRRGSDGGGLAGDGATGADAGTQQELAQLRAQCAAVEQELAETREALAAAEAAQARLSAESRDARAQVAQLEAAVRAGGSNSGGNSSDKGDNAALVSALEARVAAGESESAALKTELAEQAARNRAEQRALRARVTELEGAAASATAAAAAARARGKGDRSEADALQRQNAQLARRWDVLAELVESVAAARFSPAGRPLAALLVADYLRKGGPLDDPASFRPVVDALRLALACPMPDCATPLLWTATLLGALQDLGHPVATIPAPPSATDTDPVASSTAASTTVEAALTGLLSTAFARALSNAYRRLEPAAIECFITATADPATTEAASPSTTATTTTNPDAVASHAVLAVLAEAAGAAKQARLPAGVRRQLVAQLVHDVDATVFNALVRDEALCTCARVFRIRVAMSVLEGWLLRDPELAPAKRQLRYTREAANLFAMDKAVLADDGAIAAAFSALNIVQLARLLQYYHPDDLNKLPVDATLLRDIKFKALEAENTPLEVDGHAWISPSPK